MLNLVRKDLRTTRVFWLPAAFSYVVFLLLGFLNVHLMLLTGVFLTLFTLSWILFIDDLARTDPLFAALPLRRRDIVTGRYLTGALVTVACLGLFLAATAGLRALAGARAAHLGALFSLRGVLAFVLPSLLLLALALPFYFWKGLGRAFQVVTGILMGSTIILQSLVRPGPAEKAGGGTAKTGFAAGVFDRSVTAARDFVARGEAALGGALLAAALVLAVALALYFSWRLSVRFYSRRDL
jgi:ABC-2 family transporter protein